MLSPVCPSLHLFLLAILSIFMNFPTSISADDMRYTNCTKGFVCGRITRIKYPFWGLNRADYCGKPGFELECQDNVPLITVMSEKYVVLEINLQLQSLIVARQDLWNDTCPAHFVNTTIDFTLFTNAFGVRNLTLYYGCTFSIGPIPGFLNASDCNINNTDINAFYVTRNSPIDPRLGRCNSTVIVPIFERNAQALDANRTTLGLAIDGGFGLQWDASDECSRCLASGGECGHNRTENRFTCFCNDQPRLKTCSDKPEEGIRSDGCLEEIRYSSGAIICIRLIGLPCCNGCTDDKNRDDHSEQILWQA
ncbi:hypothetical protein RJ639_030994 [Escallonia herrerae]|uniref:non-specific serine/threonine protein kinase n=1 Tax=Escallonia herrerae TaxID=1293975 RepID=A0AA89BDA0_9ASTE|nr:hypothetical protein RJ639_030994 [Escallonia herrerae]